MQADSTTKSIRYDRITRDDNCYLIFANGTENYLGSRSPYGEGETLCNAEYYKLLENAHSEAAVNQEAPATIPEDVVTTEHNDELECTAYVCGKVKLALFDDSEDGWVGYLDALDRTADFKASGIAELRARSYLLEHPDIRRLIGRDTSQPVEVERWTGPDHEIDGVTFKASDVEVDLTEVGRFAGHIGVAFVRAYIEGDEDLEALTQAPSLASLAPRIAHARARVLAGLPAVRVAA